MEVIPFICVAIAAHYNAIMDVCSHKYSISVFNTGDVEDMRYFDASVSWKNKYVNYDPAQGRVKWKILGLEFIKPVQFTDAWHNSKMMMIIFLSIAIALHTKSIINPYIDVAIAGTVWNMTFSLFYNRGLLKKEYRLSSKFTVCVKWVIKKLRKS